jgi:signal transduction histidine kinase
VGRMDPSNRRLGTRVRHHRTMVSRTASHAQTPLGRAQRRLQGPRTRWPRAADAVLAIVVFLLSVFVVEGANPDDLAIRPLGDVPVLAFLLFAVACGAILWRRSQPLAVLAVTLVAAELSGVLDYSQVVGVSFLIALYSVARYVTSERRSYVALGAALVFVLSAPFTGEEMSAADLGFGLVVMAGVWYVGRRMRLRAERAAELEREREAEARRVVAEERTRIARELHDIVAHRVSLMTVQAGAAKTVAGDDPAGALQAMEAVEQAGRQALDELRHLLDVLRPEAERGGLGPQPGIADVSRLVDQFEDAGLHVSLTMVGVRTDLPARVDLSTYRIVEEALTNVLKHAGPAARAEVRLTTDHHQVAIEVLDDGHGATILPGSGHGIVGMRERALLLGGSLDAGPCPGGGFQVVAYLPIGEDPA